MKHKTKTIEEVLYYKKDISRLTNHERSTIRRLRRLLLPKGSIVIIPDGRIGKIIGWCVIENIIRIKKQRLFEYYKKSKLTVIKKAQS